MGKYGKRIDQLVTTFEQGAKPTAKKKAGLRKKKKAEPAPGEVTKSFTKSVEHAHARENARLMGKKLFSNYPKVASTYFLSSFFSKSKLGGIPFTPILFKEFGEIAIVFAAYHGQYEIVDKYMDDYYRPELERACAEEGKKLTDKHWGEIKKFTWSALNRLKETPPSEWPQPTIEPQ